MFIYFIYRNINTLDSKMNTSYLYYLYTTKPKIKMTK